MTPQEIFDDLQAIRDENAARTVSNRLQAPKGPLYLHPTCDDCTFLRVVTDDRMGGIFLTSPHFVDLYVHRFPGSDDEFIARYSSDSKDYSTSKPGMGEWRTMSDDILAQARKLTATSF